MTNFHPSRHPLVSSNAASTTLSRGGDGGSSSNSPAEVRIQRMHRRFARLCQLVLMQKQRHARELQNLHQQHQQQQKEQAAAPAELTETQDRMRLVVDLPGVLVKDLTVHIESAGHVLTITGSRQHYSMDGVSVIKTQHICRKFAINPALLDMEHMKARLAHGVLTLEAPRRGPLNDEPQQVPMMEQQPVPIRSIVIEDQETQDANGLALAAEGQNEDVTRAIEVSFNKINVNEHQPPLLEQHEEQHLIAPEEMSDATSPSEDSDVQDEPMEAAQERNHKGNPPRRVQRATTRNRGSLLY